MAETVKNSILHTWKKALGVGALLFFTVSLFLLGTANNAFSGGAPKYTITAFSDHIFCGATPTVPTELVGTFAITETDVKGFGRNQNGNIVITAPTNFAFDITATLNVNGADPSVNFTTGRDISSITVNSFTATTIDIQVVIPNVGGDDAIDDITFSGIKMKATAPGTGDVFRGGIAGPGTFDIDGNTDLPGDGTPETAESFGNLKAADLAYSSSAVTQGNTTDLSPGETDAEIIGIQVVTTGSTTCNSLTVTQFNLGTAGNPGSTAPATDISTAKIYYTGTTSTYSATGLFGSFSGPNGAFNITGSQTLSEGTNYFWLAYDIPGSAVAGNVVDGECTLITLGTTETPAPTNVAGSRTITSYYAVTTGNWSDNTIWRTDGCSGTTTPGSPPGATDNVIICATRIVTLDGAASCNNLTVIGTLNDDGGGNTMTVNGNFSTDAAGAGVIALQGQFTVTGTAKFRGTGTSTCAQIMTFNGELDIGAGHILQQTVGQDVLINSHLVVNGELQHNAAGNKTIKVQGGSTSNISGGGIISSTDLSQAKLIITNASRTVLAGSNLTFSLIPALDDDVTVTNNGTVKFNYNLEKTGMGTPPIWNNATSASIVKFAAAVFPGGGTLTASASGNIVEYNGTGAQTIIQPSSNQYWHLTSSVGGTKTLAGDIDIDGNNTIADGVVLASANNNITIAGNWVNNNTAPSTGFTEGSGTVTFNGTALQTISQTGERETFYDIRISNDTKMNDDLDINGVLTIDDTKTLDANSKYMNIAGNWVNNNSAGVSGFTPGTGTVTFDGGALQTIATGTGTQKFYHLRNSNTVANVQMNNNIEIDGNLTLDNNSNLDANTNNVKIAGNWDNQETTASGGFIQSTGTVEFDGGAAQTITKAGAGAIETFYNLTLNNSSGDISLVDTINVDGTLDFQSGKVILGALNVNISSTGSITGYDSDEYFVTDGDGFLRQNDLGSGGRSGNIDFPVGISTSSYTPVTLNNDNSDGEDDFSVKVCDKVYGDGTCSGASTVTDSVVDRSWDINVQVQNSTTLSTDVTLKWNAAEELAAFDNTACYISKNSGTGGGWNPQQAAGDGSSYSRTVTGITGFSRFALASGGTALPITLAYFSAELNGDQVDLSWATANETNNDFFTIERSEDGVDYESVTYITGAGNSNQTLHYTAVDEDPYYGLSYYRLKQTDYDGQFEHFKPVPINYYPDEVDDIAIAVYPNPTQGKFWVDVKGKEGQEVLVVVLDLLGKEHYSKIVVLENNGHTLARDTSNKLSSGVYLIIASSNNKLYKKKLVIR